MKHHVLQMCPLSPRLDEELAETFTVYPWWKQTDPDAFLKAHATFIAGVATAAPVGIPDELINVLPNLQVISCRGVGMDKINLEKARQKGIQVSGSFGILNDCVADMAFALLLDVVRELSTADRYVRAGKWPHARYPLSTRVSCKRLGIVGLGNIGSLVAKRGLGFDMQIGYTGRHPVQDSPYRFEATLEGLANWCDFLIVTVAGTPSTKHLISTSVLEALGAHGYLINVSRGFVVDQEALIEALEEGRIAGAGLDVFEEEPNIPASLMALDNVVLTPHMASGTVETRRDMEDLVLENLTYFFAKGQVKTTAL